MVDCECPPRYLGTIPGILKIIEMAFTILVFAISFGGHWSAYGGGWAEFTGISCFITITIWFILHLINFVPQFLVNFLIEFITYCVMAVMLLITGIVAAARANDRGLYIYYYFKGEVGACSFFAFAAAIVCAIDAVFQFLEYRSGGSGTTTTTTVTTTTTSSSSATKVEY